MNRLIVILILLASHVLSAQSTYGFKINAGASRIPALFETSPTEYQLTDRHVPRLSGQAGVFVNYSFTNRFTFGTEILLSHVAGRQRLWMELWDGTNVIGTSTDVIDRWITNISIPVYVGLQFGKWNPNFGGEVHYAIISGGRERGNAIVNGQTNSWDNGPDELYIRKFDVGLRPGVVYHFSDWIQFELNGYYGLTNLVKDESFREYADWKVQQLTIGVRFNFHRPSVAVQ